MDENMVYKGYFFLPNSKQKIPGIITYNSGKGIELEVFDNFDQDSQKHEFVLGIVEGKGDVTLYGVYVTQKKFGNIFINRYIVNYLFVGTHLPNKSTLKFKNAGTTILHFDEWINQSDSFQIRVDNDNKSINIDYKMPEHTKFTISSNLEIFFSFVPDGPVHSAVQKEAHIKQIAYVNFKYKRKIFFQKILDDIFHFCDLLTLLVHSVAYPQKIVLTLPTTDNSFPLEVELLFYIKKSNVSHKDIFPYFMLIPHYLIEKDYISILTKWYLEKAKRFTSSAPFFSELYNSNLTTVDRFLSLAKSLEAFHRDYKNLGGIFFRIRIEEMFENYRKIINPILKIKSKSKFSIKIKDYRNDFTHSNPMIQSKSNVYVEMHYLTEAMKMIMICAFLHDVGIDYNIIKKRFIDSSLFRHLAKTIKC